MEFSEEDCTFACPDTAGNAASAATEDVAAIGELADREGCSPVEVVEQRKLRKAKKVALFLAYNGKGYLVRHCCSSMYDHPLLLPVGMCGR